MIIENVAALVMRRKREGLVKQHGAVAVGRSGPAESCQIRRVTIAVGRREFDGGAGDGSNVGDSRSLIGGHSGAKQVGIAIAAIIRMMAITMRSSISENPLV